MGVDLLYLDAAEALLDAARTLPNVSVVGTMDVHHAHPFSEDPFPLCMNPMAFRSLGEPHYRVTSLPVTCVKCGGGA